MFLRRHRYPKHICLHTSRSFVCSGLIKDTYVCSVCGKFFCV